MNRIKRTKVIFRCGLLNPEINEYVYFELALAKKLDGLWQKLYVELFKDRPKTSLAVQPTPSGIYTLERIK